MESKKIVLNEPVAQTEVEVELLGCYSLPETWKTGESDTQEYTYNVNFLGIQVNNGRVRKRELTEEELKAAEEAKKGKKEIPKKKGQEVEIENQEEKKKNEELTRRGSQSSRYDDEALFYQTKEDLFKHPCVAWESDAPDNRLIKSYPVTGLIEEMKMVEFLEYLEDTGCYLDLARVPKAVEEESKKKPVKGKVQEEAKSSFYKAWVDLSPFREFGITEQQMRIKLEDVEGEEVSNARTYLFVKIKLSNAIFPPITGVITGALDLIPIKPPPPKFLPSKDGTHDFQRQIKLACKAIAAEYHNNYADQLLDTSVPSAKQKEKKELRRDEFLYYFNSSGKSQILKNKLRKSVVKICREKYNKITTLKGLNFNEKDKIYSEIYAYLLGKMQESISEVTKEKREILHEEVVLPSDLAEKEKQDQLGEFMNEKYEDKLKRLSDEAEIRGDLEKSAKNLAERTERDPMNKEFWLDFAKFMMRQCNLSGAEKYMAEVISLNEDWTRDEHLMMACIYVCRKKYNEALVFLYRILEQDPDDVLVLLVVSIAYHLLNKLALEKFFLARVKRLCQVHLALAGNKSRPIPSFSTLGISSDDFKVLNSDIIDELYLHLSGYLLDIRLPELARQVLSYIVNKEYKADKVLYCSAEIEFWSKQYQKAVNLLDQVLALNPRRESAWQLKAESMFNLKRFAEAQEAFLKSIRYSKVTPGSTLIKLGNIYLQSQAWAGAKLLFTRCCQEYPSSISWEGLGISCLNLEELDNAEKALTQANLLNDENSYVLASLAYVCLKKTSEPPGRYFQFRQCLTQALRLGLKEPQILIKIGHEYVRKFFLSGTGPASSRLDISEIKVIYKKAKDSGANPQQLREQIENEFEKLKVQGNNKLDGLLINSIERAKLEVLLVI